MASPPDALSAMICVGYSAEARLPDSSKMEMRFFCRIRTAQRSAPVLFSLEMSNPTKKNRKLIKYQIWKGNRTMSGIKGTSSTFLAHLAIPTCLTTYTFTFRLRTTFTE